MVQIVDGQGEEKKLKRKKLLQMGIGKNWGCVRSSWVPREDFRSKISFLKPNDLSVSRANFDAAFQNEN